MLLIDVESWWEAKSVGSKWFFYKNLTTDRVFWSICDIIGQNFPSTSIPENFSRLLTSVYEAFTIHDQLECSANGKDFLPLWFLYSIAAMNALLVKFT